MLVAAVLAPHRAEHAQLDQVRLAAQPTEDQVVFGGKEPNARRRCSTVRSAVTRHVSTGSRNADLERLEEELSVGAAEQASAARSGWGIRPKTFPRALAMPAMSSCEPFGLAVGRDVAVAIAVAQDHAARRRQVRRSCPRRARSAAAAPARRGTRCVNGVSVRSTRHQHPLGAELQRRVAQHGAWQQASLEQHLEAVADAQHQAAARGEPLDAGHDRREARDRAGAQMVAVGEAAGQDDRTRSGRSAARRRATRIQRRRRKLQLSARAVSRSQLVPGNCTTAARRPTTGSLPNASHAWAGSALRAERKCV